MRCATPVRCLWRCPCSLHCSVPHHHCCLAPAASPILAARRFTRIQQEAGIKAAEADDDMGGGYDAAAAAAVLSKSGGLANLLDELLEGDFDPEAYDKRMAAAFDDDYYQVCWVLVLWQCVGAGSSVGAGISGGASSSVGLGAAFVLGAEGVELWDGGWKEGVLTRVVTQLATGTADGQGPCRGVWCRSRLGLSWLLPVAPGCLALKLCWRPVPCVPALLLLLLPHFAAANHRVRMSTMSCLVMLRRS